jgi:hypothetical protein
MILTEKIKSIFTKLHLQDANFNLTYSLADVLILGKNTYYNDPERWIVEIDLATEDVDNLIKAKNALADVDNMLITTNKDLDGNYTCEFIFGDNTGFSNKITYQIMLGSNPIEEFQLPFDSNVLRDILSANKDQDRCTLKLSPEGILKLNFYSADLNSEYFVARNE